MVIYVRLPNEGTSVWVPVDAEHVVDDLYKIVDCRGEEDDVEFGEGSVVRCRRQQLSDGEFLVAHASR